MKEHKIKLGVFDKKAFGFSKYYCLHKFKINCDNKIQQHYELRLAPFCIRIEMVKKKYIELKFVFFDVYTAIQLGLL